MNVLVSSEQLSCFGRDQRSSGEERPYGGDSRQERIGARRLCAGRDPCRYREHQRGPGLRHRASKVLLVDTGVEKEKIVQALRSYRVHGVLSLDTGIPLFNKALQVVADGQIWVDNTTLKAFLRQAPSAPPASPKRDGVTEREREIIQLVCRGSPTEKSPQRYP